MTATTYTIRVASALLGTGLTPIEDASVVVRDGRIADAGPSSTVASDGPEVEVAGATLIPGFIDAHVHIGFVSPRDVLWGGVTTVRDLAWPPDEIWPLVDRSTAADFEGPSIIAAGQMLTTPGGYPTRAAWAPPGTGYEVASPLDAPKAVDRQLVQGASIVKIALNPPAGPTLGAAELSAIVTAAHDRGARVTGHIHGLDELLKALDAGVDELAHMLMSNEVIPDEVISRLVEQDVTIVPTLAVRVDDLSVAIENTARFLVAGGRIVYGTDLGNEGPKPGIDRREIDALHAAGMSLMDIIRSATSSSAEYLKLERTGAIAPGRDADLVATEPLAGAASLTTIQGVWRRGLRVR